MKEEDDYYLSQEFYNEIMAEADVEEDKRIEKINRNSVRILKAIESIKGADYVKSIKDDIEYCELNGDFKIVKKPRGLKQPDDWGYTKGVYVHQSSAYPCDDCFYGEVYFPIKENKWLSIGFAD